MFHLHRTFPASVWRADHWHLSPSYQPVAAAPVEGQMDSRCAERPVLPTAKAKAMKFARSSSQLSTNPKQLKLLVNGKQKSVLDSCFSSEGFPAACCTKKSDGYAVCCAEGLWPSVNVPI